MSAPHSKYSPEGWCNINFARSDSVIHVCYICLRVEISHVKRAHNRTFGKMGKGIPFSPRQVGRRMNCLMRLFQEGTIMGVHANAKY